MLIFLAKEVLNWNHVISMQKVSYDHAYENNVIPMHGVLFSLIDGTSRCEYFPSQKERDKSYDEIVDALWDCYG